jgi:cysteine desulfurase
MPIAFRELGASSLAIAAHKFGGPLGIGALLVRHEVRLEPLLFGGVQQAGLRPGTESVALAVGMRVALEAWAANRREWTERLRTLRDEFEAAIIGGQQAKPHLAACQPTVLGGEADRLPHVSNIAFVGLDRQALFIALDQAGVAASTGSACASGSSEPSPVHIAMGCEAGQISSALRFSFGLTTTTVEAREAARRILSVCNALGRQKQA